MTEENYLTFSTPPEMEFCAKRIFQGEYNLPVEFTKPPIILDIGANCGAFTVWALQRWPGAQIFAYEPARHMFEYLRENTKDFPEVTTVCAAVTLSERVRLYRGKHNPGEASFYPELGQTTEEYEEPACLRPEQLPRANVLKVDTEGCEVEIIRDLLNSGRTFEIIMFEFHSEVDRILLDELLRPNYILVSGEIVCFERGTLKYVRKGTK